MTALRKSLSANWKTIALTFEIFWVAVYLLDAASTGAPQAMQFVYANF